MRAGYFFMFAAVGVYVTFLNLHFYNIGLSGSQIGLINTTIPLIGILSGPVWGILSDRFGVLRRLLIAAALGSILTMLGLSLVDRFAWILALMAAWALFFSPVMPLMDTQTLALLGPNQADYGKHRLWGTVGFTLTSTFFGAIIERLGEQWIFYGFAILFALLLAVVLLMPERRGALSPARFNLNLGAFRKPVWLVFLAGIFLANLAMNGMNAFLGIHMQELGGSQSLIGLAFGLAAANEIPFMLYGGRLITRYGSQRVLQLSFFTLAVRFILYGLLTSPALVVAVSMVHGITFGVYWIASVAYTDELAEPHLRATAQSMRNTVNAAANMISALIAGLLFDNFGGGVMFLVLSGFALAAALILALGRKKPSISTHPVA
jgi:MFS family permease